MSILYILLPDIILVALGWFLLNKMGFSREFFATTEKMVYFIMFPALLFRSVLLSPLSLNTAGTSLLSCALLAFAGLLVASLARPVLKIDERSANSTQQCVYRFSTYIALSIAPSVGGTEGVAVMAVFIGFTVPLVNILAVRALAAGQGGMIKSILTNPLVLATASAVGLNLLGFQLPEVLSNTLSKLGQGSIPLGLICIGAALKLREGTANAPLVAWMTAGRLLLMPMCAILIALIMGFSVLETQMFVIFAAIPTAPAAYVLTVRMGGDARLVANIISVQTLCCVLTIPMWLFLIVNTSFLQTIVNYFQ
ncbi:putative transporter YfdV [Oligella ureolytica]|uniref:AEC family transporter n=1 Tax=Oligella ureolytica TaxID=90244 RepID=A0A378XF68_9BURK|nr:AEC family transporter [Oligella ureolytica]QPT40657.1 AEC family transporter [Oligella ureolytica]SUA52362.1 putative transporter YfdV [Oligella ureolytica]